MHSNTSSSMKHMTYIAGISMLVLLNTSCGGKSEKSKELTYDIEALDNMPADSVDIRLVNTDIEFGNPSTIDFINDTLMIVFDRNVNDYVAHIIDPNGHHIRSFGRKGNDDFVAVLDGPDVTRINEVFTFDYDGNVKERRIVGNGWVNIIGYNERGDIYCFAWDKDMKEMNLYSLPLKSL